MMWRWGFSQESKRNHWRAQIKPSIRVWLHLPFSHSFSWLVTGSKTSWRTYFLSPSSPTFCSISHIPFTELFYTVSPPRMPLLLSFTFCNVDTMVTFMSDENTGLRVRRLDWDAGSVVLRMYDLDCVICLPELRTSTCKMEATVAITSLDKQRLQQG